MKVSLRAYVLLFAALMGAGGFISLFGETPGTDFSPPVRILPTKSAPKGNTSEKLQERATRGEPEACFILGMQHLTGEEVAKDPMRAATLLERAAKKGHGDAAFQLGKLYSTSGLVPADAALAIEFYTIAARAGIPEAHYNLGTMLVSARGVKRDYIEGLAWFMVASKHGAPAEGEAQVRERLKKYPERIVAAEARAAVLLKDLSNAVVSAEFLANPTQRTSAPIPSSDIPKPTAPVLEKTKIELLKPEIRPEINLPTPPEPNAPNVSAPKY